MYIGTSAAKGYIEISDDARKSNIAVFGIKSTGKSYTLIPSLLSQDLDNKAKGVTIFVDTPELAWYLCGLCKVKDPKRKVVILKPSRDFDILNDLFSMETWDYDKINEICDFEKAIKAKQITIIDMEEERYGSKAIRANAMLLLQLQSAMVAEYTKKPNHSVYIDGATSYMPYIKNLLKYGDFYGFDSILFFKSREELKENTIILDNYVRNYILLQGLNYEDAKYFGERLNILKSTNDSVQALLNRQYGTISYEILSGSDFQREVGEGMLTEFTTTEKKNFKEKAKQIKKRSKEVSVKDQHYQVEEEANALSEKKTSYLEDLDETKPIRKITKKPVEAPIEEPKEEVVEEEVSLEEMEMPEVEEPIEFVEEAPKKEPQLNKMIKTTGYKEPDTRDFSILDTIPEEELPSIDLPDELPEIEDFDLPKEPEELELPKEESFDLTDNRKFVIGSKNLPYRKIRNKKIEKSLAGLKI